jgi:hypothetical protein
MDTSKYRQEYTPVSSIGMMRPVTISIGINLLMEFKELESKYQSRLHLKMVWYDPRLIFYNLRNDSSLNRLGSSKNIIWTPQLTFTNSISNTIIENDDLVRISVDKRGQGLPNQFAEMDESLIFMGSENPLIFERDYDIQVYCLFDLKEYPFDSQTCHIVLELESDLMSTVELVLGAINYTGKVYS